MLRKMIPLNNVSCFLVRQILLLCELRLAQLHRQVAGLAQINARQVRILQRDVVLLLQVVLDAYLDFWLVHLLQRELEACVRTKRIDLLLESSLRLDLAIPIELQKASARLPAIAILFDGFFELWSSPAIVVILGKLQQVNAC